MYYLFKNKKRTLFIYLSYYYFDLYVIFRVLNKQDHSSENNEKEKPPVLTSNRYFRGLLNESRKDGLKLQKN